MKPGRKSKPAAEKIRNGITAPSDVNLHEPVVAATMLGPADADLPPAARAEWQEIGELAPFLTRLERPLVRDLVIVRVENRKNQAIVLQSGSLIRRGETVVRNPAWVALDHGMQLEIRLVNELGLSVAARAAIRMPGNDGMALGADLPPLPALKLVVDGGAV